jgi:hypothetical protein
MGIMLLVHTTIGPSSIHGTGLFAAEEIRRGTRTWELVPDLDLIIPKSELSRLSPPALEQLLHYAYLNSNDGYVLCFDDARFCNHSFQPNIKFFEGCNPYEIADRDIEPGEELTVNYAELEYGAVASPNFFLAHASAETLAVARHKIAALVLNTDLSRVAPMRQRARGGGR